MKLMEKRTTFGLIHYVIPPEDATPNGAIETLKDARVCEELFQPSACEVDVTGAVSIYALLLASGKIPGFLDWNNSYGSDREKRVNTYCSNSPKSFME